MIKTYKDEIPPASGRRYSISTDENEESTITDITEYAQQGSTFKAEDINGVCIIEVTHSKSGDIHSLTTENTTCENIKFKATALFDYNDTFKFNNEVYTAITSNGGNLEPGAFYSGQYVFAFVNHTQKVITFQHNESIGINSHTTGLLTDYADSLPFGYHICLDTYQNTSDTDKPSNTDFWVEIYKYSVNTIFMRAWRHNSNTYEEYRFTKVSGTWTRKWVPV